MEPKTQYRIVINGASSKVLDKYPDNWSDIVESLEARGGYGVLYRRSIHTLEIRETLTSELGWMFFEAQDMAISPWETLAEVDFSQDNPLETPFFLLLP